MDDNQNPSWSNAYTARSSIISAANNAFRTRFCPSIAFADVFGVFSDSFVSTNSLHNHNVTGEIKQLQETVSNLHPGIDSFWECIETWFFKLEKMLLCRKWYIGTLPVPVNSTNPWTIDWRVCLLMTRSLISHYKAYKQPYEQQIVSYPTRNYWRPGFSPCCHVCGITYRSFLTLVEWFSVATKDMPLFHFLWSLLNPSMTRITVAVMWHESFI